MSDFETFDFSGFDPNQMYRMLTDWVIPRPIALVSTLSADGTPNLAPFSFFMLGGANPASVMISPVLGNLGQEKDTLTNIRATGEYVINLMDRSLATEMNQTSLSIPAESSEWDLTTFESEPSLRVRPHRVRQSKVQLECRLFTVVNHGDGPGAARYIIGEILMAHKSNRANGWNPIARLGGADYLDLESQQTFSLPRPTLSQ